MIMIVYQFLMWIMVVFFLHIYLWSPFSTYHTTQLYMYKSCSKGWWRWKCSFWKFCNRAGKSQKVNSANNFWGDRPSGGHLFKKKKKGGGNILTNSFDICYHDNCPFSATFRLNNNFWQCLPKGLSPAVY